MAARRPVLAGFSAVLFGLAAILSIAPTNAATPWDIGATPTTLTTGFAADVTLTVQPNGRNIDCVTISIPTGVTVNSASVGTPPGSQWTATIGTTKPTLVSFSTTDSANRLKNAPGTFVVRVTATAGLLSIWAAAAYDKTDCKHGSQGSPSPGLPVFVILPGLGPTPTPTTAPTPTPTPSSRPSPSPASPSPSPSGSPSATPSRSSNSSASPSDSPSPPPSPSDSANPSGNPSTSSTPGPVAGGGPAGSPGSGGTAGGGLQVQPLPGGGAVQLNEFGSLSTTALAAWLVPGAVLAVPSLLIVLIVLLQAGFATAWIPVTRRVLGGSRRRRTVKPAG